MMIKVSQHSATQVQCNTPIQSQSLRPTRTSNQSASGVENLIFACNLRDDPLPCANKEAQMISNVLAQRGSASHVQLGGNASELAELLLVFRPKRFFFCGHIDSVYKNDTTTLCFTEVEGKPSVVDPIVVAEMLCNCASLELVVLNGCYSEQLGRMLTAGGHSQHSRPIPSVVCWSTLVLDEAAWVLCRSLCDALSHMREGPLGQDSYSAAFEHGKLRVLSQTSADGIQMYKWGNPKQQNSSQPWLAGEPILLSASPDIGKHNCQEHSGTFTAPAAFR